jgi:citrate lyase subunit beta/citryl-CoA lyase
MPPGRGDVVSPGPALLFCPGDRPERFGKAAVAADSVIIDLEDAVAPAAKPAAREALQAAELDPLRTIVRVNPVVSPFFDDDLRALTATPYRTVMLAKTERSSDLARLADYEVIALCETPLGIRDADALAEAPNVVALTWGAEDLVAGLGGTSSRSSDGRLRDVAQYARTRVLVAAKAAERLAYDTVFLDIQDRGGLQAMAEDAAASGFDGAMCIHPSQAETVRAAYRPTEDQLARARGILAAAEQNPHGVFRYDGRMIDEPVIRQARRTVGMAP